jgi:hypothetical protein
MYITHLLINCFGHFWLNWRMFVAVLVTYERGELFVTRSEITVHHDVAISDVSSHLLEIVEDSSFFRRRIEYRLHGDYNLNE